MDWDKHGNVIEMAIFTDSFEKYIIASGTKSRELLEHIDDQVSVQGEVIGEDFVGNKIIEIKNFNVLNKIQDVKRST